MHCLLIATVFCMPRSDRLACPSLKPRGHVLKSPLRKAITQTIICKSRDEAKRINPEWHDYIKFPTFRATKILQLILYFQDCILLLRSEATDITSEQTVAPNIPCKT